MLRRCAPQAPAAARTLRFAEVNPPARTAGVAMTTKKWTGEMLEEKAIKVVHDESQAFIEQDMSRYGPQDHEVWRLLYQRRMEHLEKVACGAYLHGLRAVGLQKDAVPELREVNRRLSALTGWTAVPVAGFLHPQLFFRCLAQRRFPTTVSVRPLSQLDYLPEPDIFHDVFGHVPMHADPVFAEFLYRYGVLAARAESEEQREALGRLFWYTVEFGLIRERGEIKVYGSGLISSHADCQNALADSCERLPFSVDAVLARSVDPHHIQPVLFVIESFEELFEAVESPRFQDGE